MQLLYGLQWPPLMAATRSRVISFLFLVTFTVVGRHWRRPLQAILMAKKSLRKVKIQDNENSMKENEKEG
jgi:hypothetical protein